MRTEISIAGQGQGSTCPLGGSADHLDHFALVADHDRGEGGVEPLGAANGTCQGGAVGHAGCCIGGGTSNNGEVAGLDGCHGVGW